MLWTLAGWSVGVVPACNLYENVVAGGKLVARYEIDGGDCARLSSAEQEREACEK